jgi:hypothetical protein
MGDLIQIKKFGQCLTDMAAIPRTNDLYVIARLRKQSNKILDLTFHHDTPWAATIAKEITTVQGILDGENLSELREPGENIIKTINPVLTENELVFIKKSSHWAINPPLDSPPATLRVWMDKLSDNTSQISKALDNIGCFNIDPRQAKLVKWNDDIRNLIAAATNVSKLRSAAKEASKIALDMNECADYLLWAMDDPGFELGDDPEFELEDEDEGDPQLSRRLENVENEVSQHEGRLDSQQAQIVVLGLGAGILMTFLMVLCIHASQKKEGDSMT